jgi:hypothetical protein
MIRFFQWLDDTLSSLVPLCYLLAGAAAAVAYFGGFVPDAVVAVGTLVGFAVETHAWLQQRRVRAIYGSYARMTEKDPKRPILFRQMRTQVIILGVLVVFSMFNSNLFLANFWHPSSEYLPAWAQFAIRGSVIPILFLLTGFLTPLTEDAARFLSRVSNRDLNTLLRAHRKDTKRRIKALRHAGGDLTPVVVATAVDLGEPDVARRMRLLSEGLKEAENGLGTGVYISPQLGEVEYVDPTPISRYRQPSRTAEEAMEDGETIIRNLLAQNPRMTRQELMKRGHVGMQVVDHWRSKVLEEMGMAPAKRPNKTRRRRTA